MGRVKKVIQSGIRYGLIISFTIMIVIFLSADYIVHAFTNDTLVIAKAPSAMRIVFLLAPLFIIQVITEAYFQAIGKPRPSLYLIFFRNVVVLIPSLFLLSHYFGYNGILYTFPFVELVSTIPAIWLLKNDLELRLHGDVLAAR
jgi:Na+-driven multidrug efflux pump